jgi:hypothetical protein
MKILKNSITILSEIIVLILAVLWYKVTRDYEPLITIIVSAVALITSLFSKFIVRPKIILHIQKTDWGRSPRGFTSNNPPIINIGIDHPEQYYELSWNYLLEIRNNSSQDAYSIEIENKNIPEKTFIKGEFGKIEPLLANDKKEFRIKIIQNVTGTHIQADAYLISNIKELMKEVKILVKYKDESGTNFYTEFDWMTDTNKLKLIK